MPPKKGEAALRADVRRFRQWAEVRLDVLGARFGCGLQGKLRTLEDQQEKIIYNWFVRHGSRAQEFPLLRQDLEALDSLVNSGAFAEPAVAELAPPDGPSGAPQPASRPHVVLSRWQAHLWSL